MWDQFYGDKRDLVKWAALIHLARKFQIPLILQVAYFRCITPDFCLEICQGGATVEERIAPEVWEHFRDIRQITQLGPRANIEIAVFDKPFKNRVIYTNDVVNWIRGYYQRKLVFLDPDTGIEQQDATLDHVKASEINQVFQSLRVDDIMVFYQHKPLWTRREEPHWVESRRAQFAAAIGIDGSTVLTLQSTKLANDVVFFAVTKKQEC